MSQQLGRISGQLLDANLLRNGTDLSFRNYNVNDDLLHLDVTAKRVDVNTVGSDQLNVNDSTRTTNLISTISAAVANLRVSTNTLSTSVGSIIVSPNQTNPLVTMDHMKADDIDIKDNVVSNTAVNGSIYFDPNGTGITDILSNARVNGDLTVTGNFLMSNMIFENLAGDKTFTVGDNPLDTVIIAPDFTQDINPGTTLTYNLGSSSKRWRNINVHDNSNIDTLTYNSITISDQLQIDGPSASIHTLQSNDSVILNSDTGIVDIERIRIVENTMTNLDPTAFTLASTGIGYTRFIDNNALVIPAGPVEDQPLAPEVGTTRWNTTDGYLECFDGTVWSIATGSSTTVTQRDMEDLSNVWILVLG